MTTKDELREKICSVFGVYPDELGYVMPIHLGNHEAEKLEALITSEVRQARLDEFHWFTDNFIHLFAGRENDELHRKLLEHGAAIEAERKKHG